MMLLHVPKDLEHMIPIVLVQRLDKIFETVLIWSVG